MTEPMRWDTDSDRYVPVAWDGAFAAIGGQLNGFDPKSFVFYASGRASLGAPYRNQHVQRRLQKRGIAVSETSTSEASHVQDSDCDIGTCSVVCRSHGSRRPR